MIGWRISRNGHKCALNSSVLYHNSLFTSDSRKMQRFLKPYSCLQLQCNCSLHSVLKDEPPLNREETQHAKKLVTNRAFAWKLEDLGIEREVKLIACERAEGKKKVREATDSLTVLWDAVLRRGILFPVAVIILHPQSLHLTLEKLVLDRVKKTLFSTQIPPYNLCMKRTIFCHL